jgi:hypothetical protein
MTFSQNVDKFENNAISLWLGSDIVFYSSLGKIRPAPQGGFSERNCKGKVVFCLIID